MSASEEGGRSNLCRVCLTSSRSNQCIFRRRMNDSRDGKVCDLSEKLRVCGGIEVRENDGLPVGICLECLSKVNAAHELREQCQKADTRLRELYGKVSRDTSASTVKKDQYCQTEHPIGLEYVKVESEESAHNSKTRNPCLSDITNVKNDKINFIPDTESQNVDIKTKEERSIRRPLRSKRVSVFKRVTSMESLKNHKERQRQYIKKNTVRSEEQRSEHECPKCNRCYSTKKSLDRHVLTHTAKPFECEKCDKRFFRLDKFLQHNKLHKGKEKPKPVVCKICNKSFRKTDTMVRHLNVHKRANPKEVFSILKEIRDKRRLENSLVNAETINDSEKDVTEASFAEDEQSAKSRSEAHPDRLYQSNAHLNSEKSEEAIYRCQHCKETYTTEKALQDHAVTHDEKKFICNVCNMKFFRLDRLKSHRERYGHDESKISAEPQKPPDDKSAIKLINSWIREELDSDNEGKGFPCEICGKSYDTKKSLVKHQTNAHDTQEYCRNCGKNCVCMDKDQEKPSDKTKPFACEKCNKSFEKEVKLQRHVRIHERAKEQQDSNFKRFLCHICSKTFRQNTGLMFHMRTHTGYKPHVCKYCGRGFTSNSNCINHERTHTGDRPFVCHFCSAAFAKSCTLKAHITTHTGEANYHCKTCGKSFRRLKYLKEHRFTHTGEKPYACKICGTAYSHSGSLFVHEKKCKAQYNNYQADSSQSYCQTQTSVASSSVIVPITAIPSHLSNANAQDKSYMEGVQRMNTAAVSTSGLHVHSNSDASDVTSAVRSFAIIGQMFHS